jgi:beta-lactamase superfamily II metal-dependent hydrolase
VPRFAAPALVAGIVATALITLTSAAPLEIFFVDVEGGQATLIVTPQRQSLLIDAGFGRTSRDPDRILTAARSAGLERIDFLIATHFHSDHVGGVPELARRIAIGTFIDYGSPAGTPFGLDRMSVRGFATYESVRSRARHLPVTPGERLPLDGVDAHVVSAGGRLLDAPLTAGASPAASCGALEDHAEDGTENFRSVGIVLRYGAFRFVDLGDLSGNTLSKLVCPVNLLGEASVYQVSHHGNYDANSPAVLDTLHPLAAVMSNGPTKGGHPMTLRILRARAGLDLWQLHASRHAGADNAPDGFIANVDDGATSHWIRLTAQPDGAFTVSNDRTALTRTYHPRR